MMRIYNLNPLRHGYLDKYKYDDYMYPQLYNEFASAALRLHSLVHNDLHKPNPDLLKLNTFLLSSAFFNVSDSYYNMDANARGTLLDTTYQGLPQMADSLNHHLFEGVTKPIDNFSGKARSLGAINIQRGREHGVRSYNYYRKLVGLAQATTFEELTNIEMVNIVKLKENYVSVDDIDLFVGIISEINLVGAKTGATMASNFFVT